jgi:hypothetical protein
MPTRSARLKIAGSGASEVLKAERHWDESDHAGTSRAVFSAFVDGLAKRADPRSGERPSWSG